MHVMNKHIILHAVMYQFECYKAVNVYLQQ